MNLNKLFVVFTCFILSACVPELHEKDDDPQQVENPGKNNPIIEDPDTGTTRKPDVLHKAESCDDFKSYLIQNLIEQYLENQSGRWGYCPYCTTAGTFEDGGVPSATTGNVSGGGGGGGGQAGASDTAFADPGSVSGTNNQEAGVDELDKVKSDELGNIYLAENRQLYIIDAFPPENMQTLATLKLESDVLGLFLDEERSKLLVLTSDWEQQPYDDPVNAYAKYMYISYVNLLFVDISQLDAPKIEKINKLQGEFESARFVNGRLHLVLRHHLTNIDESFATRTFYDDLDRFWLAKSLNFDSLAEEIATLKEQLATKIVNGINALDVNKVLPELQLNTDPKQLLLQCSDVYHPEVSLTEAGLLSVTSVDSNGENLDSVAAFASGGHVYASQKALYVAQNSSGWWWTSEEQKTVIHKFEINDSATDYKASGMVAGLIKNQFSLSEHQDYLRVATSERAWIGDTRRTEEYNHLFVLKENNGLLEQTGSVEKFAPTERIFSVRFIGDRGFVVTFRNTDPLFAFDLSDPLNPVLKGELEIPGFSTYMHPIDENHLLTIGKGGTAQGATNETQLQIFDVSDLTNPIQIAAHIPQVLRDNTGWGYSTAESDHHAFTYSPADKILAIPLSYYDWENHDSFAGIATFKIDIEEGISENGMVDHSDLIPLAECGKSIDFQGVVYDEYCINRYYNWWGQPNRTVIMGNEEGTSSYLYSISRLGVKANDLNAMSDEISRVKLSN